MARLDLDAHYGALPLATDALEPVRQCALARFHELGLPDRRDERWRYTELRPIARRAFQPVAAGSAGAATLPPEHALADDTHVLTLIDGRLASEPASATAGAMSVRALSRGEAMTAPEASADDGLAALHLAFISDLIEIDLPAGARLDRPVLIRHLTSPATDADASPRLACPHIRITLGEGAALTLIEQQIQPAGSEGLCNATLDLNLAAGSELDWTRLRVGADAGFRLDRSGAHLAAGSRLHATHLDLAGRWNRTELTVTLAGAGATVSLEGLYLPGEGQMHDHHLELVHAAPGTSSRQRYRGVLSGRSRAVFSGRVLIQPGAQQSDATQENRNLLLSDEAEVDTKPELEIYADDVKAAHGATVGQLDEAAMFYLLSRGIDPVTARALLVFAFADEVLTGLPSPALRRYVEAQVMAALPETDVVAGQTEVAA
jgi:Fe-S cluster assembly protein SufD